MVSLTEGQDTLMISVGDRGCGIAGEELDLIFTPFYSRRALGTGLGLPLAAKIVNLHGGQLTVDSQPGEGTCFTLLLPLKQTPETARSSVS